MTFWRTHHPSEASQRSHAVSLRILCVTIYDVKTPALTEKLHLEEKREDKIKKFLHTNPDYWNRFIDEQKLAPLVGR